MKKLSIQPKRYRGDVGCSPQVHFQFECLYSGFLLLFCGLHLPSATRSAFLSAILVIFVCAYAPGNRAATSKPDQAVGDSYGFRKIAKRQVSSTGLTPDTQALAKLLQIEDSLASLKKLVADSGDNPSDSQLVRIMYLRQKCERATQFASLELEEALANIESDLSYSSMEYSLFSSKYERSLALNNAATFLTSGTLGVLDSASGLKYAAPVPNIFGITGNAAAVAIPLWGLRPRKYSPLQKENGGNMLAPIFNLKYEGEGYDPIIWDYLNATALDENATSSRREILLARWKRFRELDKDSKSNDREIRRLCGFLEHGEKVTLDLLKTRAELLLELRTEVQSMYADLSDLNSEIMKY